MASTVTTHLRFNIVAVKSPAKPTLSASPKSTTLFFFPAKTTPCNLKLATQPSVSYPLIKAATKSNPKGEQKWTHEGSVEESLPNGMFKVKLDNQDSIIGYISGKIRKNFVRILPGDRVKVEVSRYDSTRGRIIYRMRSRDSASD